MAKKRRFPDNSPKNAPDPAIGASAADKDEISRRQFVKSGSGMLLLSVGAAACAADRSTGSGEGTLHVTINGVNSAAPNAGKVTVTSTTPGSTPQTITIPNGGEFTGPVLAGDWNVVYELPANHRLLPGTSVPTTVTIEAGKTKDITVDLQALGSLQVSVSGFDGAQPNGGTAVATPSGGGTAIPVTLNTQGSGSVSNVVVGAYSVAYTAPTGYRLVNAGTSPATVNVPFAAAGSATFNVELIPVGPPPPPPPSVIFHSDWSTALGTTNNAVLDQGKTKPWTTLGGQGVEVVASTNLDFPTANVLRITAVAATTGFGLVQVQGLGIPAIDTSIWYRWYGRMAFPDNLPDNNTHPVQDDTVPGGGGRNWELNVEMNPGTAGKWQPTWRLDALDNGNDYDWIFSGLLDKNVTYRFELQIKRTGNTSFEMHGKIFNSAGTQIAADANFHNFFNTKTLATPPSLVIHNAAGFDDLNVGCNGISGTSPPFPFVYAYWGAVAVSTADWIGPYANGI